MEVDFKNAIFKWESEGEVHITLPKNKSNPHKYWPRLEKTASVENKVQIWWDMKDEHTDLVEDLRIDERKAGIIMEDL